MAEPYQEWLQNLRDSVAVRQITKRVRRLCLGNPGDVEVVVLLFGGDKGSQQRDIVKAKMYWKDYWG